VTVTLLEGGGTLHVAAPPGDRPGGDGAG
jgi:hypothetical protein